MRILLINPTVGEAYGQERVLHELGAGLRALGHRVYFLAERVVGELAPLDGYGLIPQLSSLRFFDMKAYQIRREMLCYIESVAPDLVHFHDALDARLMAPVLKRYATFFTDHTLSATCPASTRQRGNAVCEVRSGFSCLLHDRRGRCLKDLKSPLHKLLTLREFRKRQKLLKACRTVFAVSEFGARLLRAEGFARVLVCSNPVTVERAPRAPRNKHIVMSTRLVSHKGVETALHALALLGDQEIKLHVFGDGPRRSHLADLSQSLGLKAHVRFHGRVPRAVWHEALLQAHVFLQSNVGPEPFGLAAAEAAALGVPVVCARVPALNETLGPWTGASFFKPTDPRDLARALTHVFKKASDATPKDFQTRENFVGEIEEAYRRGLVLRPPGHSFEAHRGRQQASPRDEPAAKSAAASAAALAR